MKEIKQQINELQTKVARLESEIASLKDTGDSGSLRFREVEIMRCAYCFRKITWSEWLFKGHINARCENKDEEE
jgi:hypothetical protein